MSQMTLGAASDRSAEAERSVGVRIALLRTGVDVTQRDTLACHFKLLHEQLRNDLSSHGMHGALPLVGSLVYLNHHVNPTQTCSVSHDGTNLTRGVVGCVIDRFEQSL